ncbi:MAG: hypothetical protein H8K05_05705 [Nitrospira sp.]|nr:hypothetical protein [Nitrospira sp.]
MEDLEIRRVERRLGVTKHVRAPREQLLLPFGELVDICSASSATAVSPLAAVKATCASNAAP